MFTVNSILDPLILGYDGYYSFRARYRVWEDLRTTDCFLSKHEELIEKVESHSFRVLKKIVWILLPKSLSKTYCSYD